MTTPEVSVSYEDRYVAYIDILAFKDLVQRLDDDAALLERIVGSLKEVQTYSALGAAMDHSAGNVRSEFFYNMFQMSTFSDSIAMSTKANPIGLGLVLFLCAFIYTRLMNQGVFVRGGISRCVSNAGSRTDRA